MSVHQQGGTGRRETAAPSRLHRRTHQRDAAQARTRILDAAEQLFAQHGFDGTSTAHIAHTADVPKGLLFYYFPAKGDILTALLEERLGGVIVDPTPLMSPGDPVAALMNVADTVLRNHAASDVLREIIWHEAHTRAEVRAALTRYRHGLHDAIEQVLRGSLPTAVGAGALRAAASAWAAIVTARPLEGRTRDTDDAGADAAAGAADPVTGALHERGSLRGMAELLCRGLAHDAGV